MACRKPWLLVVLFGLFLLSSCGSTGSQRQSSTQLVDGNDIQVQQMPTATAVAVSIQGHHATPTPTVPPEQTPDPTQAPLHGGPAGTSNPSNIPTTGPGTAPYGSPPPMTELEISLTQQLFALINKDRQDRGLYTYSWNATLSGGARLHSWNMYHCGFSHTCPDGLPQCDRIAREGFQGFKDCGENIAYAGPFPTPWGGVYKIQEGMVNEPPSGWHRIHLFSTTLHEVGVGVFIDPGGYIWFTEDMVG
ncbi:hypothetical protein EPA93_42110 [Ktedonosporobacter rubrisoli]|uniref:SCP domain-containing protein n=1 Tax=Ktedonosporobacter rubrisoli TaxID=2509675 RepID=A0A4P6K204_KTERU|nr:CAP domain-containing protein [Ktedonosporobacter rubrisoli]QBD82227.1 hypothetical protein EPA93_42110 [Ktedonosporobacter rubrisoli]